MLITYPHDACLAWEAWAQRFWRGHLRRMLCYCRASDTFQSAAHFETRRLRFARECSVFSCFRSRQMGTKQPRFLQRNCYIHTLWMINTTITMHTYICTTMGCFILRRLAFQSSLTRCLDAQELCKRNRNCLPTLILMFLCSRKLAGSTVNASK